MTNAAEQFQSHRFFPEVEHFRNVARLHRLPTGFPECLGALPVRISQDHTLRSGFTELFRRMQQSYPDFSLRDAVWILLTAIGGHTAANRQVAPEGVFDFVVSFVTSIGGWPESRRSGPRAPEPARANLEQPVDPYSSLGGSYDSAQTTGLSTRWNGGYQNAAPAQEDPLASIAQTLARLERSTSDLRQHLDSVEQRLVHLEPRPEAPSAPQNAAPRPHAAEPHSPYFGESNAAPPAPLVHRADPPPAISPVPQPAAPPVAEAAPQPPAAAPSPVRTAPRPRFAAAMDLPQTNSSFAAPFQHGAAPLRPAAPEPAAAPRQAAPERETVPNPPAAVTPTPEPPSAAAGTVPEFPPDPTPRPEFSDFVQRPEPPPPAPPVKPLNPSSHEPGPVLGETPRPAAVAGMTYPKPTAPATPSQPAESQHVYRSSVRAPEPAAPAPAPAAPAAPPPPPQPVHSMHATSPLANWPAAPATAAPAPAPIPAPAPTPQPAPRSSVLVEDRPQPAVPPQPAAPASRPEQPASRLVNPPAFGTDLFGQHSPQDHDELPKRSRMPLLLGLFAALVVALALGLLARGRPLPSWTHFAPNPAKPSASAAPADGTAAAPNADPSTPAPRAHTADPAIPGKVLGARAEDTDHTTEQVFRNPTYVPELTLRSHLISGTPALFPRSPSGAAVRGTVVLKIIVRPTGSVDEITVLGGPKSLRDAAVNAVRDWRFQPTLVHGAPAEVRSVLHVPVEPPDGR